MCELSDYVDGNIADGVNELVNMMLFIPVTMHMITRYMCTYVSLHPTCYVEYTMQLILRTPSEPESFLTTQIII